MVSFERNTLGKSRRMEFPNNDSVCGANWYPLHRLEVHATVGGYRAAFPVSGSYHPATCITPQAIPRDSETRRLAVQAGPSRWVLVLR